MFYIQRHPDANTWRSKTIDYEKLSLVYGIDAATIQFPRPLSIAGCAANVLEEGSIPELNPIEVELAHEWLVLHKEMSSIFLSTPNKREWILRRLPKIRGDSFSSYRV